MDDVKYVAHMFEEMRVELKAVHELVAEVPNMARKLDDIGRDVTELKQDMTVVKASVRSLAAQVHDHELRIGGLETA